MLTHRYIYNYSFEICGNTKDRRYEFLQWNVLIEQNLVTYKLPSRKMDYVNLAKQDIWQFWSDGTKCYHGSIHAFYLLTGQYHRAQTDCSEAPKDGCSVLVTECVDDLM